MVTPLWNLSGTTGFFYDNLCGKNFVKICSAFLGADGSVALLIRDFTS